MPLKNMLIDEEKDGQACYLLGQDISGEEFRTPGQVSLTPRSFVDSRNVKV